MSSSLVAPGVAVVARRRGGVAVAAAGIALLAIAGAALGADPPLSFAEALRLAVDRAPQLASQQAMADAARAMAGPAGELPDPKLRLGVENVPTSGADRWSLNADGMTMQRIGVMQEFPREEKRRLRAQRAEDDARRNDALRESTSLAVRRDTASAWLARRYADEARRVIAEQIAEAELAAETLGGAYRAGKATQAELIAARGMLVELRNRATEAAAQARRATIALARWVGPAAERPLGEPPDLARLPFDAARSPDVDLQPEVRIAQAQERIAETDAQLARAAKQPDWSAELAYQIRGSAYPNMVSLMFSVDLPWSQGTRQDRELAAKLRELDAARAMSEDARRMRAAEVESMLAEWESARAQARRIRDEMLPLAAQRRDAALAAYRGATGPLAAVLDARRAELDAHLALIQQEQAAARAWAFLQFVLPVTEKSS